MRQAVILAGGLGTRLGALTQETPKPLLPVAGVPFLEYLLWNLRRHGIRRIVFSAGYLADRIIAHFGEGQQYSMDFRYVIEPEPAGTGGALRLAAAELEESFLLMNGDTLFDLNYLDLGLLLESRSALAALALRHVPDAGRYGSVRLNEDRIVGFAEKTGTQAGIVNGGVYALRREVIEYLPPAPCSLEKDLFPHLSAQNQLLGKVYNGFFIDIGLPASLSESEESIPRWLKKTALFLDATGTVESPPWSASLVAMLPQPEYL
jgi:D-glycero-D-manno-heptose 1,7-bisphosphate phosphatase